MTRASDPPLVLRRASRRFGARVALDAVDFEVAPGTIAGLVGPNGSGKTTLFRLLAGLLRAHGGEVRVFGHEPFSERMAVMRRAQFAFAPPALFGELTAREHLRFLGRLGNERPPVSELERALADVGLTDRADEPVRRFSFGMRQRLGLALALVPRPELLVLDEPTDGLDPLAVIELRELLRRLRDDEGLSILLSSHHLVEVDELADDLLVLFEGRAVFRGSPGELAGGTRLVLAAERPAALAAVLDERGIAADPRADGELALAPGALSLEQAAALATEAGTRLTGYRTERPSLEAALLGHLANAGERR